MEVNLEKFRPSQNGLQIKNHAFLVNDNMLKVIKENAFINNIKFTYFADRLIKNMLRSGVCSGLSTYILLKFRKEEMEINDPELYISVLQVRTLGRPFFKQSLKSYFFSPQEIIVKLLKMMKNEKKNYPLLVFYPAVNNLRNISLAHTVLPYALKKGFSKTIIRVYDSNYPEDDKRELEIDNLTWEWNYEEKNSKKWRLTVNNTGNLTKKVNFIW